MLLWGPWRVKLILKSERRLRTQCALNIKLLLKIFFSKNILMILINYNNNYISLFDKIH